MTDPYDPYRSGYPEPYQDPYAQVPAVPAVPSAPPTTPYPNGYPVNPYGAQPYGYPPQYSDKRKVTAGLLQLLLGMCLSLGGVGRLYAGNVTIGVVQICASAVAWVAAICAVFTFGFTLVLVIPIWLWFVIDGIVMLVGNPVDGQGRPLRP